ncbi:hypothetical protein VTL71DRAFT_14036 [Oculimacula yallundae]|uniref:Zn(2)-C6 fungal-type domain-containing protein n=1 Tax=Oculimacula yallundae TaxID=86028 RepID=A0ABR4CM36_9HELO
MASQQATGVHFPPTVQPLRPRRSRTKTGCLTCRLRRRKCDEQKPECNGCTKSELICSWLQGPEFAWRVKLRKGEKVAQRCIDTADFPTKFASMYAEPISPPISRSSESLLKDSASQRFLHFFIQQTSSSLVLKQIPQNVFVRYLLPFAETDDLVMHSVLAVGGIHLSHYLSDDHEIETKTWFHYGKAIERLKFSLSRWHAADSDESLRLLITTVLLQDFEAIRGNVDGEVFQHLRASRQIALTMFRKDTTINTDIMGVVLEAYCYRELVSSFRLGVEESDNQEVLNSFVVDLSCLQDLPTFGSNFWYCSFLFMQIPLISQLARHRQRELREGIDMGCDIAYTDLYNKISSWRPPGVEWSADPEIDMGDSEAISAMVIQTSLLLFLVTSFYHKEITSEELCKITQPWVTGTISLLAFTHDSPTVIATFWPIIVIGSYAREVSDQRIIQEILSSSPHQMPILVKGLRLLNCLWRSQDSDDFGLSGLERIADRERTSLCIG